MAKVKMLVSIASPDWSYVPQEVVDLDDDLAKVWVEVGHAEYVGNPPTTDDTVQVVIPDELKQLGGGWYELPDGTRVRGKNEALQAFEQWKASQPVAEETTEPETPADQGGGVDGTETDTSPV